MSAKRVVIVGAGHAGGTFAALLRRAEFKGEVVLIGSEPDFPYHRPPLSKSFRPGDSTKWLYDADFYADNNIDVRLGETAIAIDRQASEVELNSGDNLAYDYLVLATGAEPRRLPVPGDELEGIRTLRTLADAQALRASIENGQPLAIVGGGYVGLEVAAAARGQGVEVTVIEREARLLSRVASPTLSRLLAQHHEDQETKILTNANVTGFVSDRGHVDGIELSDGTIIPCSSVLIGAGAIPREALAQQANLVCDGGIVVDHMSRTSDPKILAIGDVTKRPLSFGSSSPIRLESIPSAVEQSKQAVAIVMERSIVDPEVPWFWSDQFDLKIKIVGIVNGEYETVLRGDPEKKSYALFHHRGSKIVAVESVNSPRDFMAAKQLISSGIEVHPADLADSEVNLREILSLKTSL